MSTSFHQLHPTIPVIVTSKGGHEGIALGWADYSTEHSLVWIVGMRGTGEIWLPPSEEIRLFDNWSLGREIAKLESPVRK